MYNGLSHGGNLNYCSYYNTFISLIMWGKVPLLLLHNTETLYPFKLLHTIVFWATILPDVCDFITFLVTYEGLTWGEINFQQRVCLSSRKNCWWVPATFNVHQRASKQIILSSNILFLNDYCLMYSQNLITLLSSVHVSLTSQLHIHFMLCLLLTGQHQVPGC